MPSDRVFLIAEAGVNHNGQLDLALRLVDAARAAGCRRMILDTGLENALAQRFYFRFGMLARGLHFGIDLA